jgi:hypothetical protein
MRWSGGTAGVLVSAGAVIVVAVALGWLPAGNTSLLPAEERMATSVPSTSAGSATTSRAAGGAYWRDRWGKDEIVQRIRPAYDSEYINNPHKGTATFQRFNGDPLYPTIWWDDSKGPLEFPPPTNKDLSNDRYPPTRISYCRWLWRVIEPEKGKIRFDILDAALKTAAERHQTLQLRIQPYIGNDAPAWYYQLGGTRVAGSHEIDHNTPAYLQHWGDLIRALGQRYDGHPALESFDIAYGGACGEGGGNATAETAARLVDVYCQAFRKTQLLSMLGTPGCKYGSTLKGVHLGWRADCYGDIRAEGLDETPDELAWNHMRDAYPQDVENGGVKDAWKTAPVTFETGWTVPYWQQHGWDIDWIIAQAYRYHASVFMPKSVYIPDEWMPKIMEMNKRLGYRFHIHQMDLPLQAKPGQMMETHLTIDNRGVAPIYRPYHFALRFGQGGRHYVVKYKADIRTWLPDLTFVCEKIVFPAGLSRGEVKISCSIVNDDDQPVVRLAIKPVAPDGWHPLTSMDVVDKESLPISATKPSRSGKGQ